MDVVSVASGCPCSWRQNWSRPCPSMEDHRVTLRQTGGGSLLARRLRRWASVGSWVNLACHLSRKLRETSEKKAVSLYINNNKKCSHTSSIFLDFTIRKMIKTNLNQFCPVALLLISYSLYWFSVQILYNITSSNSYQ